MKKNIYLSIVIPAYNEEKNIEAGHVLDEVWDYMKKRDYVWEVLLIDDGSTDNTPKLLKEFANKHDNFNFFEEPHRGKAGTIIAGMLKAKGQFVLFTDMDQSTPLNQIEKFLPKLSEGYDVVIGSRSGREGNGFIRLVMSYGFILLRTIILGLPYKDTQCGFKAFKNEEAKKIFSKLQIFRNIKTVKGAAVTAGFDLEILYIARKLKLKVAEIPVYWHDKGLRKIVNPIKDSWEGLRDMIKVRINAINGKYKLK